MSDADTFVMTVDRYLTLLRAAEKNMGEKIDLDELKVVTWAQPGGALIIPPTIETPVLVLTGDNARLYADLLPEIKRRWAERSSG